MTIDAPFACCWGWGARRRPSGNLSRIEVGVAGAWPDSRARASSRSTTMLLWIASAGLFLLCVPDSSPDSLVRPGFWIMTYIAAICCLPILWWNVRTGWSWAEARRRPSRRRFGWFERNS